MKNERSTHAFNLVLENLRADLRSLIREFTFNPEDLDKSRQIYKELSSQHAGRTDSLFFLLMFCQIIYLVSVVLSNAHATDGTGFHFTLSDYMELGLGSFLATNVFYLAIFHSGKRYTRHAIGIMQMVFSTLIIHASQGSSASYIHLFCSLAFLAFYRDPAVILSASFATITKLALHWAIMGTVGGKVHTSTYLMEQFAWILIADVFLIWSCIKSSQLLRQISLRQFELEELNARREEMIHEQRKRIQTATKMAVLGEMSTGFAHEINNPLAITKLNVDQLHELLKDEQMDKELLSEIARDLRASVERTMKIVKSLKTYGREGKHDPFRTLSLKDIVADTIDMCRGKFRSSNIRLELDVSDDDYLVSCRSVQVSQVIMNLLQNAADSIEHQSEKWVKVGIYREEERLVLSVTDSGNGIPEGIREHILKPYFTTKEEGKGTGLGLSLSRGIMEEHQGTLALDPTCPNTRFLVTFPELKHDEREIA